MARNTVRKKAKSRSFSFVAGNSGKNRDMSKFSKILQYWPLIPFLAVIVICVIWRQSNAYTDQYKLRAIEVVGLQMLTGEEILEITGLSLGDNLIEIEMSLVAQRLENYPWIKHAVVRRKPPDLLIVEIVERRRIAWIKVGKTFGLDSDGVLLPEKILPREANTIGQLPLIRLGESFVDSLVVGSNMATYDDRIPKILDWWIQAKDFDSEFCIGIKEVGLLDDGSIVFWMAGDGLEIRLPYDRPHQRLIDLKSMMPKIYLENSDPHYIDLRYAGQVVVGGSEGIGRDE